MPQFVIRQILILLVGCLLGSVSWFGGSMPAIAATHFSTPTGTTIASLFSFSGTRPANLGIHDGKFAPCPSSPNCVSSQSQDADHRIAPLTYGDAPEVAFERLKTVVRSLPGTEVIAETDDYLYTEFTSALMGFVDDVEFFLNRDAGEIEVRSASRLGESDLGVNRQRIEQIRSQLNQPNLA
jgi:uncharacterized protein (DUF1499 family)